MVQCGQQLLLVVAQAALVWQGVTLAMLQQLMTWLPCLALTWDGGPACVWQLHTEFHTATWALKHLRET
jgi:hypothetical protein